MDPAVAARLHNLYWSLGTVSFIVIGSVMVGWLARGVVRVRGGSLMTQRRAMWGFALASPWLLGFVIFVLGPALASLYYSFTDYKLGSSLEWIGLDNYRTLLAGAGAHGRRFMQSMYNSFYYAVVGVPLQIVTALGMAMLVAPALAGMRVFRLIFYLPVILAGGPAILLAWRYMLASNGGYINVSLKSFANAFPPFDWLYRSFIFTVESFNAFYAGVVRNDPVGPLMYVLPAVLGAALCCVLLLTRDSVRRPGLARALAEPLLALLALSLVVRFVVQGAGGFFGRLEAGTWRTLVELMTFQSALREPAELVYLRTAFSAHAPSALWIVAILAVALFVIGRVRLPRQVQDVILGGLGAGFLLLAVGSFQGGVAFFRAFEEIAAASGSVNHHFALFRQATAAFPDSNRVPLWLSSELWSKPSLVLITMWSSGAGMLIFLAALKGVPRALYEAADVDGASGWQKFWRVTLPMISPAMFYNIVIGLIAALQTFEAVYIIQNTQTESSLASAAYFLFVRTFRQLEIGQGAAASWILAVIIVLLTVAQFRYSRWVHYS